MAGTDSSGASLSSLVDGLVAYLGEQQKRPKPIPTRPVPDDLARVFQSLGDHLVALMLVAQSDDKVAATEREVILHYCADRARKLGWEMSSGEEEVLGGYLRHFHPTLAEIISAVERLRHGTKSDIAELIAAARAVVEADGVVRLPEVMYLGSLERDLLAL